MSGIVDEILKADKVARSAEREIEDVGAMLLVDKIKENIESSMAISLNLPDPRTWENRTRYWSRRALGRRRLVWRRRARDFRAPYQWIRNYWRQGFFHNKNEFRFKNLSGVTV